MDKADDDQRVWDAADSAAYYFGEQCAKFHDERGYREVVPLNVIINTLVTELWDRRFSQTDIRTAFEDALNDMNRYAGGAERRT